MVLYSTKLNIEKRFNIGHKLVAARAEVFCAPDPSVSVGDPVNIDVSVGEVSCDVPESCPVQVSREHGRSLVVRNETSVDANNIVFTCSSRKGVMFGGIIVPGTPRPESPQEALLALWPRGLGEFYTQDELHRYFTASEYLRNDGLPTDWVQRVLKVSEVNVGGKMMNAKGLLLSFAEQRVQWLRGLDFFAPDKVKNPKALESVISGFTNKMNQAELYIVERMLPVVERTTDLAMSESVEELRGLLRPACAWMYMQQIDCLSYDPGQMPDIETDAGLEEYLKRWLPRAMGMYLHQMHERGLVHVHPHEQNWMTIGALADCDSVRGSALGGSAPTAGDYAKDVQTSIAALELLSEGTGVIKAAQYAYPDMCESFEEGYSAGF